MSFTQTINFTGTPEDVTLRIRTNAGPAIRWSRGKDQIRAFSPPKIGDETMRLDNIDRALSPGNTLSPWYGLVKKAKEVKLSVSGGSAEPFEFLDGSPFEFLDGSAFESFGMSGFDLFTGVTDRFKHNPVIGEKSVDVSCLDMLVRLTNKELSTAIYYDIRIDAVLTIILDAIGWPADKRLLDVATVTLPIWWMRRQDAYAEILELVFSEGALATFYCDGAGNFVFKNNTARLTEITSIFSQATFSDTDKVISEDYEDNANNLILAAQVTQQERAAQGIAEVWSYEGDLVLGPNEEITLLVENSDPFQNIQEPSLVGINAEQLLIPSAPLTSGTYIANVNGTDTAALNWNDSTATIQSVFDTAAGAGNTFLTGALATGLRVKFIGDLAGREIPLITIKSSLNPGSAPAVLECQYDGDGTNGVYKLFAPQPLSAGTCKLRSINGNTTTSINFDASDTIVESRLVALPLLGPADVNVSGGNLDSNTLTVTFDSALGVVPLSVVDASSLRTSTGATAEILVTELVKGGQPDVMFSSGDASFVFERESGADVPLKITASASGAALMKLRIRAQLVTVIKTHVVTYPTSIALPDGQIYKPSVKPEIPLAVAQSLVFDLYTRYHDARPSEQIVTYTKLSSSELLQVLQYGIGTRVTIVGSQNMINEDFFIEQMEHVLDWNFQILTSTFGCERAA